MCSQICNIFCHVLRDYTPLCWSVGPSVGPLVGLSPFTFFVFLRSLASLLLPKWCIDLNYGPCPPARDWGSRVSGLVWPYCSCTKAPLTSIMAPAHPHATRVAVYPALLDIAGGTDYTSSDATPFKVLTILAEWELSFDYILMALQLGLVESDAFCSTSPFLFRTFLFIIIFRNLSLLHSRLHSKESRLFIQILKEIEI